MGESIGRAPNCANFTLMNITLVVVAISSLRATAPAHGSGYYVEIACSLFSSLEACDIERMRAWLCVVLHCIINSSAEWSIYLSPSGGAQCARRIKPG